MVWVAAMVSGCGYSWQGINNPWRAHGVERIYVRTLTNNTLIAGAEVPFTSALVKQFVQGKRLLLVGREEDADAVLLGTLLQAESRINTDTTVSQISRATETRGFSEMVIASDYVAVATIDVQLVRRRDKRMLWNQSFSGSKIYPGNNRFGVQGSTSSLINSSQEAMALSDLSVLLASDAYDTMLEAF